MFSLSVRDPYDSSLNGVSFADIFWVPPLCARLERRARDSWVNVLEGWQ